MLRFPASARRAAALFAIVVTASVAALTGCASPASTALPEGVTIDVYQSRIDYSEHKIEVAVANASHHPFTIHSLSFVSPTFDAKVDYARAPSAVRAGTTTDIRLLLPLANCDATPGAPTVHLTFRFGGADGSAILHPKDRMGQLPKIAAEDCRDDAVAEVASIVASPTVRYENVGGQRAAILDFTATPTGAGGVLTLDDVRGTVLLGARNPQSGVVGDTVPLGLDIGSATTPVTFSLTLLPARCDPHVVLEDKRGTFFTFTVTTKVDTGRIFLGVTDAVRTELYDFVGSSCGWT